MRVAWGVCLLVACVPNEDIARQAKISCAEDVDCPSDQWSCVRGFCLHQSQQIPVLRVAFVSPADGEENVSVTTSIVVAFNLDVDLGEVAATLTPDGGEAATLQAIETALTNTFRFTPQPLQPRTRHTLRVLDFESTFVTGDAPDVTPPGVVSSLVVTRIATERVKLDWSVPADGDFAGVLILRRAGSAITAQPENGRTYAIGALIGDATVIASVDGATWDDVTVGEAESDYALFAFDTSSNYAPSVRAPFVSAFTMAWCPSETGSVQVPSPDVGTWQLRVDGMPWPNTAVALNEEVPLAPLAPFVLGEKRVVQLVASGPGGTTISLAQDFWASPQLLTPNSVTPDVRGVGAQVGLSFPRFGWTELEAQFDTQGLPGEESYAAIDDVLAVPSLAGSYRLRVRPVVAGCGEAEWTVSDEFQVGIARFVAQGGTGDGSSPQTPSGSIADVLAPGTDVFVAAGLYDEPLQMPEGVRVFGGWNVAFSARDPAANVTTIRATPMDTPLPENAVIHFGALGTPDTVPLITGFTLEALATAEPFAIVQFQSGRGAVVNNRINVGNVGVAAYGIGSDNGYAPQIQNNVIVIDADMGTGIFLQNTIGEAFLEGNDITAMTGVSTSSITQISNNRIRYPADSRTQSRIGINVSGDADVRISGNRIDSRFQTAALTRGIIVTDNAIADITANAISGGGGTQFSIAVGFDGFRDVILRNNVISAGDGQTGVSRFGVDCNAQPGGMLVATNNTIYAGHEPTTGATFAIGSGGGLIAVNNLLVGEDSWYGFYEQIGGATADAASIDHNVFASVPSAGSYRDDDVDPENVTSLVDMQTRLTCQGVPNSGNVVLSGVSLDDLFVSFRGNDNDALTLEDNDWRVRPLDVANNALLRSALDTEPTGGCGAVAIGDGTPCVAAQRGAQSCELDAFDADGTPRVVPWTAGAYEQMP